MITPGVLDRVLHLLLYVSAIAVIGTVALAAIERLVDGGRLVIRVRHVAIPIAAFAAIGIAERLYHVFS